MCSNFSSSLSIAPYLKTPTKILSVCKCFASCAFRRDTSEYVADGNWSKTSFCFYEGNKFCSKMKSLSCLGTLPSPIRFRSLLFEFKKLSHQLPFDLLVSSLKTWRTILSGPAPEPFGKDETAFYISNSGTEKLSTLSGFGAFISAVFGCLDTNFLLLGIEKLAILSAEVASYILSFIFPSWSFLLITFILCSRTVWGGLDHRGRDLGSETMLAPISCFL